MYLYWFTSYAWIDKITKIESDFKFSVGDLLLSDWEFFLVLGPEISFLEQYNYVFPSYRKLELFQAKFVSKKYIERIHWMVYQYYSTYKSVIRYFLSQDIEGLFKRKENKKPKKSKKEIIDPALFGLESLSDSWQTLVVYPDLWTMYMMTDTKIRENSRVSVLSSINTQLQKNKAFWKIKNWDIHYILTTHAEIFQDFLDLKEIVFVHPHKRYYANQQDPRYKTGEVLDFLADLYWISVQKFI